jgi:2-keto-4-pentenoate hydratase/2-oxohepta-3-ene-1,7-dioic acid hydratase in catechol pathway
MKLVSFRRGEALQPGALVDGHVADLSAAAASLLDIISSNHEQNWLDQAVRKAPRLPIGSAQLVAPIPLPRRNIFCVGKNYAAHAREFQQSGFDATSSGQDVPTAPVVFTKAPSSVIGPEAAILANLDPTNSVDYEGELGVVIGRGGQRHLAHRRDGPCFRLHNHQRRDRSDLAT